jgi:L-ascorbate metabolism protein UlaG (beta-lactamase superfamily)
MEITHLGHAAVLVQSDDARILIDPGNFSDQWHGLTGLTAVLVTHQHPDHVDPSAVGALLEANPDADVLVEPAVVDIVGERARAVESGQRFTLGPFDVSVVGGQHAVIHADIPRIGNVGFLIREPGGPALFHPGDELDTVPQGVDVLAAPAYGPWAAVKETVDFVRAVAAPRGFLIHDRLLSERGWALVFGRLNAMTPTTFTDLRDAGPTTF